MSWWISDPYLFVVKGYSDRIALQPFFEDVEADVRSSILRECGICVTCKLHEESKIIPSEVGLHEDSLVILTYRIDLECHHSMIGRHEFFSHTPPDQISPTSVQRTKYRTCSSLVGSSTPCTRLCCATKTTKRLPGVNAAFVAQSMKGRLRGPTQNFGQKLQFFC